MSITPRQREVLTLIARGRINKEIADELGISPKTVERHREHIFTRIAGYGPRNAVMVVVKAMKEGLISV